MLVAATERELCGLDGVVCGVGPVEAAARTAEALVERQPGWLLHIGIAGARDVEPLTVVIGSEAIYCDTDSPLVQSRVLPDERLLAAARRALPEALVVPIGTSARVGGTTGCEVEAMEGFAVLRAAALAGVPALEARVVANAIDEPDRAKWRFDEAFAALADAVPRVLAALSADLV